MHANPPSNVVENDVISALNRDVLELVVAKLLKDAFAVNAGRIPLLLWGGVRVRHRENDRSVKLNTPPE